MNKFIRYPVSRTRSRLFLALCAMAFICGAAGVTKVGPPLWRTVTRALALRQARAEWRSIMQGHPPSQYAPLCHLEIPAVSLDIPVLADSRNSNLSRLPCLSAACSDLEQAPVIVAHRDLHFRELQGVEVDDRVYLTHRSGERVEYRVLRVHVVRPDVAERVVDGVHAGTLTLVTCFPFRYIGPAPERFVVVCERRESIATLL